MPSTLTGSYTNPHPILIRLQDEIYWLVNYDVDGYITLDNAYSHKLHAVYMDNPHYENIVSQIERQRIYYAILCERAYQDRKYGTPTERMLDIPDYIEIMRNELDEAAAALAEGNPEHALCELLQATTVGIACIEFHGLIERPETQSPNHPIP